MIRKLFAILAVAVVLAGCSKTSSVDNRSPGQMNTPAAGKEAANAADIMFVQMMIPHHQQAIEMSGYAKDNSTNSDVLELAGQIAAAQQPEIDQMTDWLHQWGVHDMSNMDQMHMGDDGMLSDSELTALKNARGAEFDRQFLLGMIGHHEGAVAMAKTVLKDGLNPKVRALAESIVGSQTEEIARMKAMLKKLR